MILCAAFCLILGFLFLVPALRFERNVALGDHPVGVADDFVERQALGHGIVEAAKSLLAVAQCGFGLAALNEVLDAACLHGIA